MEHTELQLLPGKFSTSKNPQILSPMLACISFSDENLEHTEIPSTDLQLSISQQPGKVYGSPSKTSQQHTILGINGDGAFENVVTGYGEVMNDMTCAEAMKKKAEEQLRLATIEKAYAEKVRELTRREMELAESEYACARRVWEKTVEEMESLKRMEKEAPHLHSNCMKITCHVFLESVAQCSIHKINSLIQ